MELKKGETNNCVVTTLTNVRPHGNADRLQLATVLSTQVIVGLEAADGDIVLYFDSNLRLSHDYLHYNNQYSNSEQNADTHVKGYFPKTGRVKCQRFRGEASNGYVVDIDSLAKIPAIGLYCELKVGDEFTHINGHEICSKYIVLQKGGTAGAPRPPVSDMFFRHWDTKHLMRELQSIPVGPLYIEEKIHGTSGRTGNVLCDSPWWKFWTRREWRVVSGTRRVDNIKFHLPEIRAEIHRQVAPHLRRGETIYYEIFGNNLTGAAIQAGFSYGCRGGEWHVMLYRVTFTTVDGHSYDLDRQQVYARATELGLMKPVLLGFSLMSPVGGEIEDQVADIIKDHVGGRSTIDAGTLREGIACWFQDHTARWTCLKHKGFEYLKFISKQLDNNVVDCEDTL
jgi:hypothetical protein